MSAALPPKPPGMWFAPELPLDQEALAALDYARLKPCTDALYAQVVAHLNSPPPQHCQIIALHGGLGQGKSTVLNAAIARLRKYRVTRGIWDWLKPNPQRPLDMALIDVSLLKADQLDKRLLSSVMLQRFFFGLLRMLATTMGLAAVIWGVLWLFEKADLFWAGVGWCVAGVGVLALLPFGTALKSVYSSWESGYLEQVLYRWCRFLGVLPDLICVDDLDRATLDQQRAVLRALARHARAMHCAVVVSFDESDLMGAKPNPEAPEELLRKLIQISIRIPARTREDAVLLAISTTRQWAQRNDAAWPLLAPLVQSPRLVGLLARAMQVTQSIGPRRSKGLLAETLMAAQQRGIDGTAPAHADDLCALLLVTALTQAAPQLMRHTEAILAVLERSTAQRLDQWLDQPESAHLKAWFAENPPQAAQVRCLLALADAHLPTQRGWRGLLSLQMRRSPTPVTSTFVAPATTSPHPLTVAGVLHQMQDTAQPPANVVRQFLIDAAALLDRAASGYSALAPLLALLNHHHLATNGAQLLAHVWPLALSVAHDKTALERLRVHEHLLQLIDSLSDGQCPAQVKLDVGTWTLREWLCDRDVVALMPPQALQNLFKRPDVQHRYWPLVKGLSQADKQCEEIETTLWGALSDPQSAADPREQDLPSLALERTTPRHVPWVVNAHGTAVLERAWPPLHVNGLDDVRRAQLDASLKVHLGVLCRYGEDSSLQTNERFAPHALLAFFDSTQSWMFSAQDWLDMLGHLLITPSTSVTQPQAVRRHNPFNWAAFGDHLPLPLRSPTALNGLDFSVSEERNITAFCLGLYAYRDAQNAWLSQALWGSDRPMPGNLLRALLDPSLASVWTGSAAMTTALASRLLARAAPDFMVQQLANSFEVAQLLSLIQLREDAATLVSQLQNYLPISTQANPFGDQASPI